MAKYKFSLSPPIRAMVEWDLKHYPEYKKNLDKYKADMIPSTTQKFEQTTETLPGYEKCVDPLRITARSASRPTEIIGMSIATSEYISRIERCNHAVEKMMCAWDRTSSTLIDLVYWKETHSIEGAAMQSNVSRAGAYKRINNILYLLALEMGYVSI